ncbi:MAG: hypothetical protein LIO99_12380 [Clostridiales bacterium]|nr:hypothetical protein [Clostridiales bacterium]
MDMWVKHQRKRQNHLRKWENRTSIENEYALMACTLEQARKEDGSPRYKRTMIYEWLDEVRKMGNLQSFQERRKEAVFLPDRDVEKCRKKNANVHLT